MKAADEEQMEILNSAEVLRYHNWDNPTGFVYGGIAFDKDFKYSGSDLPKKMKYTVRMNNFHNYWNGENTKYMEIPFPLPGPGPGECECLDKNALAGG